MLKVSINVEARLGDIAIVLCLLIKLFKLFKLFG